MAWWWASLGQGPARIVYPAAGEPEVGCRGVGRWEGETAGLQPTRNAVDYASVTSVTQLRAAVS